MLYRPYHTLLSLILGCATLCYGVEACAAAVSATVERVFPAGLWGEFRLDINDNYSVFRNQKGLLIGYPYRAAKDYVLGLSGAKAVRVGVQEVNARLLTAFLSNDIRGFLEIFSPSDSPQPSALTDDQLGRGFEMLRRPFLDCTDAVVVGEVLGKDTCHFIVNGIGSKSMSACVLGYDEYKPNKWRFKHEASDAAYSPVFLNALIGPPLEIEGSIADWKTGYVAIPLPDANRETNPASEILFRVEKAKATDTGKAVESVLEAFLTATEAFSEVKDGTTTQTWENLAATVAPCTLKQLHDGYDKALARGRAPRDWKNSIVPGLRAWDGRRFVVDCNRMAFLLCIDDVHPTSVGCVSFLKGADGGYRLCNINVQADFVGLFYNDDFCVKLKEKLLLIP